MVCSGRLIMVGHSETNSGLRIILIEDNPFDTELIQESLKANLECNVIVVMSRPTFLAELERELPDVILADSNVPRFDSMAALDVVRERHPQVPFIFCSGNESQALRALAMIRGAKGWVSKNDLPGLVAEVKRICGVE